MSLGWLFERVPGHPGPDATAARNAEGLDCAPPKAGSPPDSALLHTPTSPTPASPALTTVPPNGTGDDSPTASASTDTPGQPGFTLLVALASLALEALAAPRRLS